MFPKPWRKRRKSAITTKLFVPQDKTKGESGNMNLVNVEQESKETVGHQLILVGNSWHFRNNWKENYEKGGRK